MLPSRNACGSQKGQHAGSHPSAFSASIAVIGLILTGLATGCSGGSTSSGATTQPPSPNVTVGVSAASSSVLLGLTDQFSARVTGTTNTAVTWGVDGVAGGNVTVGTIDANGLYTAPADLPNPASIAVTATSQADSSVSGKASVTVTSDISVSLSTTPALTTNTPTSSTLPLAASVTSQGKPDRQVSWSVSGIGGGNSTVGTISSTGAGTASYQAPSTVPTPFTVSITATSAADPSKSASISMTIAGTIASATQNISAPAGGTITLPDGSNVTVAPGFLGADQEVTLTEYSVPVNPPPSPLVVAIGPSLALTFSSPIQMTPAANKGSTPAVKSASASSMSTSQLAGITFNINVAKYLPSVSNIGAALANFTTQLGQTIDEGALSAWDSVTGMLTVGVHCVQGSGPAAVVSIEAYASDLLKPLIGPLNSPKPGLLFWNAPSSEWLPFTDAPCPRSPTLVVVHGMLSSVEASYKEVLTDPNGLFQEENYGLAVGFDYDWSNGLQVSGSSLATSLEQVAACSPGQPIDIMAHSEGVPVVLTALEDLASGSSTAISAVRNLVLVAGPVLGTPIADDFEFQGNWVKVGLVTLFANIPSPLQEIVLPQNISQGWPAVLGDDFAKDLQTDGRGTSELAEIRDKLSLLSHLNVILVGGANSKLLVNAPLVTRLPMDTICQGCLGIFQNDQFDGIVGLDSAFWEGIDFKIYRVPAFKQLSHTELVNNTQPIGGETYTVNEAVSSQLNALNNGRAPTLKISSTSASAWCPDERACLGSSGTAFVFTATGFTPNTSINVYKQEPMGVEDDPAVAPVDSNGIVTWQDQIPSSKALGAYGVWFYDPNNLVASDSVIEKNTSPGIALTVASTNPDNGATVGVAPADNNGRTNGTTSFELTYASGTSVTLNASPAAGGNSFSSWNGCDSASGTGCIVTMGADRTVTANYVPQVTVAHTLMISSTNPNTGVAISANPGDNGGQSNGTTQFTLTYNSGIAVTLTAPSTAAGNNFSNWTGCDNASTTTCSVMMNGNRTVIANYSAPGTSALVVASTNPGTGVPVTVSPADNSGNADGNTLFTRTYTNGTTVTLNVPSASGGTNFSGWTGCDSSSGTSCTVMMATENRLVTANYGSALTPACVYVANLGLAATGNNVSAYRIDPTTGALTSVGSFQVGDLSGPRALATDPAGRFLYVAASLGFIAGYTIQPDCSLGQQFTTAAPLASGPESIAIDPSGKFLYVIYSLSGGGAVYAIDLNSGALQQTSTFETGQVPIWITIDPPGHFAYVANLFSNNASGYEINPTTGALLPIVGPPPSPFPAETFPLSVASDPTGRFAYIANYLATNGASISSDISAYRVDSTTGGLNAIGGSPFGTGRFLFYLGDLPAASTTPIVVHPNGVWLYAAAADTASNAGAVFLFALDPLTGTLTPKQIGPFAAGQDPVAIALDPTGQFLYVANFTSSNILTYVVDPSSGALTGVPNSATQTGAGPSAVIVTGKKPLP